MVSLSHYANHIYPLLRHHLAKHSEEAPIDTWVQEVLGQTTKSLKEWEKFFEKAFARNMVHLSVEKYCSAKREEERYDPFCKILNDIIDLAFDENSPLALPTPSLGKIRFCRNDPNVVVRDNSQDAQRKPDIVTLSQPVFERYDTIHRQELRHMFDIKLLEQDIANYAVQISKLEETKSSHSFFDRAGDSVDDVAQRIARLEKKVDDVKKKRTECLKVLRDFRQKNRISTHSNSHTYDNPGAMTQGIDWHEILGPVEMKDLKAAHIIQAAFALWTQIKENQPYIHSCIPPSQTLHNTFHHADKPTNLPSSLHIVQQNHHSDGAEKSKTRKRALDEEIFTQSDQPRYGPKPKHDDGTMYSGGATSSVVQSSSNPLKGEEQAASYALELLAGTNGTRSHCIVLIVDGEEVQFWYYDASGMIRSSKLDWFQNFEQFAAIVVALGCLDLARWGVGEIPNLTPPTFSSPSFILRSLEGYKLTMNHAKHQGVTVTLGKPIFSQYSLVGRRTLVYNITTEPRISDRDLTVKMSWQVCTRLSEAHILKHAEKEGVEHLPELHMWTESDKEYRISQGIRGKLFPDNKGLSGEELYEDRSLRFMVFTKYEAITLIISPSNMDYIFMQLIACLEKLRAVVIVHRDLSITNLMHDPKRLAEDKKPHLILNDFDLASFINPDGSPAAEKSSKHRTGTLPFMARDILENPKKPHYLRHDLESALYMAFWLAINFPFDCNGQPKKKKDILLCWKKGTLDDITSAKIAFMSPIQPDFMRACNAISEEFKPCYTWLLHFWNVFGVSHDARLKVARDHMLQASLTEVTPSLPQIENLSDDETMFGSITPFTIRDALKKPREILRRTVKDFIEPDSDDNAVTA